MKRIAQRIFADVKKFWPIPIMLLVLYFVMHKLEGAFCPSVIIFGLPCPGCGIVRALLYVLKGQFAQAFYINPSVYLWIVFLLYIIVVRYILGKPLKHVVLFVTVIVTVMVIRFGYGMYRYYPERPPFAYTGGNVMEEIIPGYMHMVRDFKLGGY
ncbi:MAG: DUF2752 domain-containing protein [Lachnospiraceae bacterium]|nr:DUF2752 domain-containing protein [Lachnospiraceae bacterium]